jgi:lysophospholipase L1-like esterase
MGNLIVSRRATPQTAAIFSDDFQRADQNLEASANWTLLSGGIAGGITISSNEPFVNDTSTGGSPYTCPDIGSADMYVQASMPDNATGAASFLCLRLQDQNNWLGVRYVQSNATLEIYKRVAGTLTRVASCTYKIVDGDVFKYEQYGNNAVLRINGDVRIGPVGIGSLFTSVTKAGLVGRFAAGFAWYNFEAGQVNRLASSGLLDIACWGDSLTAGQQFIIESDHAYPTVLQNLTGRFVYNGGINGETSTSIKNRQIGAVNTDYRSRINVFWAGRNNYTDPTTVKADIATMVATQTSGKYIVLSVLNSQAADNAIGQSAYTTITTLNSDLATLYGSNYYDIRAELCALAGPGPYSDPTHLALDQQSSLLTSDGLHQIDPGYVVVANRVNSIIASKGW